MGIAPLPSAIRVNGTRIGTGVWKYVSLVPLEPSQPTRKGRTANASDAHLAILQQTGFHRHNQMINFLPAFHVLLARRPVGMAIYFVALLNLDALQILRKTKMVTVEFAIIITEWIFRQVLVYHVGTCVPCADGFIAPRGAVKKCTECPRGARSLKEKNKCVCKAGRRSFNGTCVPCEKGTAGGGYRDYCYTCSWGYIAPRSGMSKCERCPKNTTNPGQNSTRCVPIPKCKPGFIFHAISDIWGARADPECISTSEGCTAGLKRVFRKGQSVCVDSVGNVKCPPGSIYDNVSKCIMCDAGKFVTKSLKSSKLRCKYCPENSTSPGGVSTTCRPCPEGFDSYRSSYCYCDGGKYIRQSDGVCVRCPTNSVNSVEDNVACKPCVNGLKANAKQHKCICKPPMIFDADGKCVKDNTDIIFDDI